MRRSISILFLLVPLLGGCTSMGKSKETLLTETLQSYAATLRWGDILQGQNFLDPAYREKHPLSQLDMERYHQVQVSGYDDQPPVPVSDTVVVQTVQIGLVNVNTQSARTILDRQTWRYDDKAKRWWLTSGLPDITRHN